MLLTTSALLCLQHSRLLAKPCTALALIDDGAVFPAGDQLVEVGAERVAAAALPLLLLLLLLAAVLLVRGREARETLRFVLGPENKSKIDYK